MRLVLMAACAVLAVAAQGARRLETVGFTYGNWLCGDAVDQPHGFEVDYVRIVGR